MKDTSYCLEVNLYTTFLLDFNPFISSNISLRRRRRPRTKFCKVIACPDLYLLDRHAGREDGIPDVVSKKGTLGCEESPLESEYDPPGCNKSPPGRNASALR
jgi:hypothetical protein